jgi:molecular chaperone Hsp33
MTEATAAPTGIAGGAPPVDMVQPFQIERGGTRGRLVRLGPLIDTVLGQHAYPEPVALLLAEMLSLAVALSSALKYDGVFTLQTKGDGPVRLMVADVTSRGDVRGYAQFDEGRLAALTASAGPGLSVPRLLGAGYLAFTVDQGTRTERYQGIVELTGATLVDCIHHYFRQSEQLDAGIKLAVAEDGGWHAGVLMLQRVPEAGGDRLAADAGDDEDEAELAEDGWRRALALMGSATSAELTDRALAPNDLLYRLFHEDGVRVFTPVALRAGCRCSRERVEEVLRALPRGEVEHLKVDGRIEVTCEFCNRQYAFDEDALARLLPAG